MESISAAIESIPDKKDALRRALELLDGRSPITLRWSDIQTHFDALQASIETRFRGLEASALANPDPNSNSNPEPNPSSNSNSNSNPNPSAPAAPATGGGESGGRDEKGEAPARPELKDLCAKMDATGLRHYIVGKKDDVLSIRAEVAGALQCAGDPAKLVLDVMEAFYRPAAKPDKEEFAGVRRVCLLLLDKLSLLPAEVRAKGRDRALALARVSMASITDSQQNLLENRAFLQLVVTFDLYSALGWDVLCSYIVDKVARRKQVVDLCRAIFPLEKVPGEWLKVGCFECS